MIHRGFFRTTCDILGILGHPLVIGYVTSPIILRVFQRDPNFGNFPHPRILGKRTQHNPIKLVKPWRLPDADRLSAGRVTFAARMNYQGFGGMAGGYIYFDDLYTSTIPECSRPRVQKTCNLARDVKQFKIDQGSIVLFG